MTDRSHLGGRTRDLKFKSKREKGQAWELLGTIIFYLLNPGLKSFTVKCPEAA